MLFVASNRPITRTTIAKMNPIIDEKFMALSSKHLEKLFILNIYRKTGLKLKNCSHEEELAGVKKSSKNRL